MSRLEPLMLLLLPLLLLLLSPLLLLESVRGEEKAARPPWIQCTSNLHCAPGYCCRMGFQRYSTPNCEPLLKDGEHCKPGEPFLTNGTRGFPDGSSIELEDVYVMFCPCAIGLSCDREASVCRDSSEMKDFNHLSGSSAKTED